MADLGLPPLPPGWTEHTGPNGQPYYYHLTSQQSTYIRPLPTFPVVPLAADQQSRKNKEKPLVKTAIPGTEWLRVKTTAGNVFYTHKGRKESFWVVPEEIKGAVEALESEEAHVVESVRADERSEGKVHREEQQKEMEVKAVKAEVQEAVKRKAEGPVLLDEVVITKKVRVEEEDTTDHDEGSESDEEEWQREAAAQLVAEAEKEKQRLVEESRVGDREVEENVDLKRAEQKPQLTIPDRVDLSVDEAKALFKTLLREKAVNPLHPWDTSLPLFIADPRYVLLPSVSARREAFDEYCRDRARELRQQKVKMEKPEASPKQEFDKLLSEEVKSTRTIWSDFRRTWKKDRHFWGWGKDDRERERRFKEHLRELGEKKRAAAEQAEAAFFVLLRESGAVTPNSLWKDVKRKVSRDPRYDAVGSSSLREDLFNTFLKVHVSSSSGITASPSSSKEGGSRPGGITNEDAPRYKQQEKKARALREREQIVRAQRGRTEAELGQSRMDLSKEEGEQAFRTLLTDAIRDPQVSWDIALPQLKTDPRFVNSPLLKDQQLHLFRMHTGQLRERHLSNLHTLFEAHAPSIASPFSSLPLDSVMKSLPAIKLGLDRHEIEREFEKWQRDRTYAARKAFDEMLAENSFVEFWGRFGKIGGEGVNGGVKAEDLGEDEGEGFGGRVDMKALAKNVDLSDIVKVLKNDSRYIKFQHVPEQRERWIRDHLSGLSAPKLSVHI